jgi:hypothetical protein
MPVHATSQRPAPHSTSSHDCLPEQVMLHEVPSWQLTPLRHALSVSQAIVHA